MDIFLLTLIISPVMGYLIGSVPFGLVLCKLAGLEDIRNIGSGNIGATNVLRTGHKFLALATLLLDSGKGAIAVIITALLIKTIGHDFLPNNCEGDCNDLIDNMAKIGMYLAGLLAIIGHCYPVWLKFKGGKGVATTLGTLIAISPILGLITCTLWFLMALIFRISSLAALVAVGFTPLIAQHLYNDPNLSGLCAAIVVLVYLKHRENIKRIFKGEEPKIGQGKNKPKKETQK